MARAQRPPTRRSTARTLALAALAVLGAVITWRLRPGTAIDSGAPDAAIVVGCAWLAWALAGYLAIATSLVCVAHLVGDAGRLGRTLRHLAPTQLRRLIDAAVTGGVAATIITTAAAGSAAAAPRPTVISERAPLVAGSPLDWPGLAVTAPPHPSSPRHQRHHREPMPAPTGSHVVVQAGDTLWSLAAHQLGPGASGAAITSAWHAWYDANRDVIGANPSVITPGQHLVMPTVNGAHR